MADDREDVADAARAVVAGVADAEAALTTTEELLEAAEARAEAAEDAAELLAEAALRDSLGKLVIELREDFTSWRDAADQRMQALQMENNSLSERVASLTIDLEALKASTPQPLPVLTPETLPSSIPESLPEAIAGMVAEPTEAAPGEDVPQVVAVVVPKRRGRFI